MAEAVAAPPAAPSVEETAERAGLDWVTPLLVVIFVLSGASGLIYQITWVRLLSLTFGVTIYAVSTVVAAFMGGLALGSFLGGRLADRVRLPVFWYGLVELAIGVLGVKSIEALAWVQSVYLELYPRDAEQAPPEIVALRFGLAAFVVLIPTTLMGATLPLMVRGSLTLSQALGARVSWLYASNTGGAILGTLAAGFVLIGPLGITGTIIAAATLNTAAAIPALLLGAFARSPAQVPVRAVPVESAPANPGEPTSPGQAVKVLVMATFAIQGLASLAYEVVWTRVFAVLLDGTTYAFAIVLATVLLGIALGSALIGPLISWQTNWVRVYAFLQAGVAAFGFLGMLAFARIYDITTRLAELPLLGPAMESDFGWMGGAAAVVVLPIMLLLGASFPIAARIVVSAFGSTGRDLGLFYAGNTAGAILGAWAAGFLLIPSLGSQRSLEALAVVNGLLAVGLGLASGGSRAIPAIMAAAVAVGYLSLVVEFVPDMYQRMLAGRFPGRELVWVGEGLESTITVVREPASGELTMFFNGQPQASDNEDVIRFHRLLGHLPMALHPDPQNVLIVGVGEGGTASAFTKHQPARLDIVELSEIAMEGAGWFRHLNGDILDFPFVHFKLDDGRNHLLLTDRKYDVIAGAEIWPRTAGAAILYSYEYFDLARRALKPGGLMAQWLPYEGNSRDTEALRQLTTRTFGAVFPYVTMWVSGPLLIGSNEPLDPRIATLEQQWAQRDLRRVLDDTRLDSPEAVRRLLLLNDEDVRAWAGKGALMTDDRPYAEYFLSLPIER